MNRGLVTRLVSGVIVAEIIVVILLLFVQTCCPTGLDRLASASEGAELVLFQPATDVGPNPFIAVSDREAEGRDGEIEMTVDPDAAPDAAIGEVGTYGGTKENTCDPELLVKFLTEINPAKGKAWATAQGIAFDDIASFVATLTPAVLQKDTKITNYGYKNGLTSNPSVLAKGTAVLVDANGVMRVRCMCGNPIGDPPPPPPPPPPPAECEGTVEVFGFFDGEPTLISEGQFDVTTLSFGPTTAGALLFFGQFLVTLPDGSEGLVDPDEWAALGDLCEFPPIPVCTAADIYDDGLGGVTFGPGVSVDLVLIPFVSEPGHPVFALVDSNGGSSQYFDLDSLQSLITGGECRPDEIEEVECVVTSDTPVYAAPDTNSAVVAVFDFATFQAGASSIDELNDGFIPVGDITGNAPSGFVSLTDLTGLCLPPLPACVVEGPFVPELAGTVGLTFGPGELVTVGPALTQINGVPHAGINELGDPLLTGFLPLSVLFDPAVCDVVETTTTTSTTLPPTTLPPPTTTARPTTVPTTASPTTVPPPPPPPSTGRCETDSNFHREPAQSTAFLFTGPGGYYDISLTGASTNDVETGQLMLEATTVFAGSTETGWVYAANVRGECGR